MNAYTTTKLLTAIERQSFAPTNQSTFSTSDILELADEVLKTTILPAIVKTREEYFVSFFEFDITENVASYTIPERSIGMTVREVQIVNESGKVKNLPRTSIDRLPYLNAGSVADPCFFYLLGNAVVLFPTPSTTINTLRLYCSVRPGNLVETSETAIISSINTTTNVITVSSIPSTWITGNTFDLIQRNGGHQYLSIDLVSSLVSGTSITLPSIPDLLAVGDYISLAGESSLVQLPPDFQPVLATLTAAEMLLSMSQPAGEKVLAKGVRNLETATKMLTPRVFGEDELILPDWT